VSVQIMCRVMKNTISDMKDKKFFICKFEIKQIIFISVIV